MRPRIFQLGSVVVAVVALGVLLYNATLVDRRPPSIARVALSAPAGGDDHVGQTLTAIDIEFSEPVRTASVETRFHITPYVAGTFSWDAATTAIFTPSHKLPSATTFTVTVDAGYLDLAGNAASQPLDPWTFTTVGPPAIVSSQPAAGAADVPVGSNVTLTFDRPMDTSAVESALSISPPTPHHVSWSGTVVTISFDSSLAFGTDYQVVVGVGAADTDGSHLVAPFRLAFSTVRAGLGVAATVPAPNVSGASVRSPIALVFDRPIDPATISGALSITPPVSGTLSVADLPSDDAPGPAPGSSTPASSAAAAGEGRVLLFTPSAPLATHTTYTVTLEPHVAAAGAPGEVAVGRQWTFTTGQPTTTAQNQIAFITSRAGVRNVWLMNPDGSNPRQVTSELAPVSSFDVSANGRSIAYAAAGVVKVASIDGSQVRTLTAPDEREYAPQFSPDGSSLVVGRRAADGTDLGYWLVPAGGGAGRQVLATGAPPLGSDARTGDRVPAGVADDLWQERGAWSDDGRRLLLATSDGQLHLVEIAPVASPEPISIAVTAAGPPAWDAATGSFLVVGRGDAGDGLYRIAMSGLATSVGSAAGSVAVASSGAVATLAGSAPDVHAAFAPGADRPRIALTSAADLTDRQPSFSPDGSTILFLRATVPASGGAADLASAGIWVVNPDGRELRQLTIDGTDPRWLP